ncbi:MAG: exo-alpha-sialidase [Chloroflexi bacterium]|nr:MAG: exo-alpha-sialidase [Chloroflexota bacterium]
MGKIRRRLLTASFIGGLSCLISALPAFGAGGYAGSNAGIANIQVSTRPVSKPCPATADWLRDPTLCTQRWSTVGNDKSESDLQVDPTNPNHLVGLSKVFWSPHDYLFDLEWFDSEDGGRTWTMGLLPGYDGLGWAATTDPTLAFDAQGNLYTLVLAFNFVIEKAGFHNWSVGQTEPLHLNDAIYLSRSLKGIDQVGRTWQSPVQIATYNSAGNGRTADKQWVGADIYGHHPGSVYMSWIQLDGASFSGQDVFSVWDERNGTFTTPRAVTNFTSPHFNNDPYVFTGPEGNVYFAYDNLPPKNQGSTSSFQVMVSHDNGASFGPPGQAVTSTVANQSGQSLPDTYRDGTPYTITANPATGELLMAFERYGTTTPRRSQWLVRSSDEGQTWSIPKQIDDANVDLLAETTQAKIFAAPSGIFGVAFYDRRLVCPSDTPDAGAVDTCIDVTIQFFNADGSPRGGNRRVTQESWDPNVNPAVPGGVGGSTTFIGDYFGGTMTTTKKGTFAHLLFVSTSPTLQAGALPGGDLAPPYQQQIYASVPAP